MVGPLGIARSFARRRRPTLVAELHAQVGVRAFCGQQIEVGVVEVLCAPGVDAQDAQWMLFLVMQMLDVLHQRDDDAVGHHQLVGQDGVHGSSDGLLYARGLDDLQQAVELVLDLRGVEEANLDGPDDGELFEQGQLNAHVAKDLDVGDAHGDDADVGREVDAGVQADVTPDLQALAPVALNAFNRLDGRRRVSQMQAVDVHMTCQKSGQGV
mmetsp:Transcript_45025/g.129203  ORF Transcript_45025/g.129203 Transcript_45025/m.129203 type:complete len:212 (+) Transcript_45025:986-1621(+)